MILSYQGLVTCITEIIITETIAGAEALAETIITMKDVEIVAENEAEVLVVEVEEVVEVEVEEEEISN